MVNPGISGNTFGVHIDTENNTVTIAGEKYIEGDVEKTRIFAYAYRMGRDHKKMEIKKVLNVE